MTQSGPVNGVKGVCCLSYLQLFHPISGTCIDYMHSVLEGVVKSLFTSWFSQESHDNKYSLRCFMQTIDSRLLSIQPPKYVPTAPRSIYTWKTWRAHEYLSFLLYYSLPIFADIMDDEQLQHLTKLCIFMEILLSREIRLKELECAETLIINFVKDYSELYSESSMLSGVHELLHLVDCTKQFGPLNYINCFQFEELNRKVVGLIHGRDLLGEEFIKLFSLIQNLSTTYSHIPQSSKFNLFIKNHMKFKTSNKKRLHKASENFKLSCPVAELDNTSIREVIRKKFNINDEVIDGLDFFNKVDVNGILYTSNSVKTKFCDSCFVNENNKFGCTEYFFVLNDTHYTVARKIYRLFSPFSSEQIDSPASSLHLCYISEDFSVEEVNKIKKVALIKFDNKCYVSNYSTSHLFS